MFKNLCHEIITDTLLTSDTLTVSASCALQAVEVDLSSATRLLSMALGKLRYIRASWESIITMASAIATVWKIPSQFTVVRKRRTKRLFDELSNDERLQDPELAFKTQVCCLL